MPEKNMNNENKMHQEFMDRLRDVEMEVTVKFGQTELPLRDVAALGGGSMIELNRTVDEPVELLVNNCPFARGEVVVVDGYYSVRVTEVSPPEKTPNTFLVDAMGGRSGSSRPAPTESADAEKPAPQTAKPPPPKPQAASKPPTAAPGTTPPTSKTPTVQRPPTGREDKPKEE